MVHCKPFTHNSDLYVHDLIKTDALAAMCDVLGGSGDSDITLALATIENILTVREWHNLDYMIKMHKCGGIDKLEMVQEQGKKSNFKVH